MSDINSEDESHHLVKNLKRLIKDWWPALSPFPILIGFYLTFQNKFNHFFSEGCGILVVSAFLVLVLIYLSVNESRKGKKFRIILYQTLILLITVGTVISHFVFFRPQPKLQENSLIDTYNCTRGEGSYDAYDTGLNDTVMGNKSAHADLEDLLPIQFVKTYNFEVGSLVSWEQGKGDSSAEEVNVSSNYAHSGDRSLQVFVKEENTYSEGGNYGSIVINNLPYSELKAVSAWVFVPKDSVLGNRSFINIEAEALAEHYDDEDKIMKEIPFPVSSSAMKIEPGKWTHVLWLTSFTIHTPKDFHIGSFKKKFMEDYPFKFAYPLEWKGEVNTIEVAVRNFYKPIEGKVYFDDIKFYT